MRTLLPSGDEGLGPAERLYMDADRPERPGRPWVLANMVTAVDGSASVEGRTVKLSSDADRRLFHLLRSLADVILVGAATVRDERYGPVRLSEEVQAERQKRGQAPVPPIAVLSRSLAFDWSSPFFTAASIRPIILTAESADPAARERAAEVADVVVAGRERVDLAQALAGLAGWGAEVVLAEGGPMVIAELLAGEALDELCLTLAPIVGGDPLNLVTGGTDVGFRHLGLAHVIEDRGYLFLRYLVGSAENGG